MRRRDLIINISPFVLWMLIFMLDILGFGKWEAAFYVPLSVYFLLPIAISIYNTVRSEECGDLWIKNIFMGASNSIGILFLSAFSSSFVEYDPEMEPVLFLVLGVTVIYTVLLTLICCGVKKIFDRK